MHHTKQLDGTSAGTNTAIMQDICQAQAVQDEAGGLCRQAGVPVREPHAYGNTHSEADQREFVHGVYKSMLADMERVQQLIREKQAPGESNTSRVVGWDNEAGLIYGNDLAAGAPAPSLPGTGDNHA